MTARFQLHYSSLTRQSPAHAKTGSSGNENHVLVIAPFCPSGSAKCVRGIKQRHCGLRARPIQVPLV